MKLDKKTVVLTSVAVIIFIAIAIGKEAQQMQRIRKPDYDEGSYLLELDAYLGNDSERIEVSLDIEPDEVTIDIAMSRMEQVYEQLPEIIRGDNVSLDDVKYPLQLVSELDGVSIFWISHNDRLIESGGQVHPYALELGQAKEVTLEAVMSYGNYRMEYPINVTIVCNEPRSYEEKSLWLAARLQEQMESQKGVDQPELPEVIDGIEVSFTERKSDKAALLLLLPIAAVAIWAAGRVQKEKEEKSRQEQMEIDYCEVVSKLVLLMGAGLTIRRAWEKIVQEYQSAVKPGKKRFVYEEMIVTVNELAAGIPERLVYENFGRRCNLGRYIKLGSLLEQNFVRGSGHLLELLQVEADKAFEERKQLANRQGQEATTKLLLPMMLELVAVMAIVMVPAFISF